MTLSPTIFITAVALILATGIYSLVVTRNMIRVMISVEILTKGVTLILIAAGYLTGNMAQAQAYVVSIIVIEVIMLVVATGIVLGVYRANGSIETQKINNLKG